jgi:hypothetical protein
MLNGLGLDFIAIFPQPRKGGIRLDAHGIAYDERYVWDCLFRPFRARVSVWVPLTQAFSLGFVISPPWGSRTTAGKVDSYHHPGVSENQEARSLPT